MFYTHVQCSIAGIHVSYTRTVQYYQYPCVIHTYSAVLQVSMCHTHVQCSIASIHVSYTRTVQYCQYPCVIHTYSAVLSVSMCYTHVQCSIASINVSYTRTVQDCQNSCFIHTYIAVLPVSMCHTQVCVKNISLYWMNEIAASVSDGTGLPKHAALYITFGTVGCTTCLNETFPCLNSYAHRNVSQNVELFYHLEQNFN